jgi:hypothetical protein
MFEYIIEVFSHKRDVIYKSIENRATFNQAFIKKENIQYKEYIKNIIKISKC